MDAYKHQLQGAGLCAQICSIISVLAICAGYITLTVYLGQFAMNNPNGDGWYGIVNGQQVMDTKASFDRRAATAGNTVTDLDHVHDHFVTWFMWGFINHCGVLGSALLICIPCCPPVLGCFQCSNFAWWIAGMVWRLRESGSFASGDIMTADANEDAWINQIKESNVYQYESGNFMWVFYMITWILMGVGCICGCVGRVVLYSYIR